MSIKCDVIEHDYQDATLNCVGWNGLPNREADARINHTEHSEKRCVIKRWYTIIVSGLKVLCLPNKSQGGASPLRVQSWLLYYGDIFTLNLPNHVRPAAGNNMLHWRFNHTVPMTPAKARKSENSLSQRIRSMVRDSIPGPGRGGPEQGCMQTTGSPAGSTRPGDHAAEHPQDNPKESRDSVCVSGPVQGSVSAWQPMTYPPISCSRRPVIALSKLFSFDPIPLLGLHEQHSTRRRLL